MPIALDRDTWVAAAPRDDRHARRATRASIDETVTHRSRRAAWSHTGRIRCPTPTACPWSRVRSDGVGERSLDSSGSRARRGPADRERRADRRRAELVGGAGGRVRLSRCWISPAPRSTSTDLARAAPAGRARVRRHALRHHGPDDRVPRPRGRGAAGSTRAASSAGGCRCPPRVRVVVCNTMVRHELASGEYNARRADCEAGVAVLARAARRSIRALRDATLADLDAVRGSTVRRACIGAAGT